MIQRQVITYLHTLYDEILLNVKKSVGLRSLQMLTIVRWWEKFLLEQWFKKRQSKSIVMNLSSVVDSSNRWKHLKESHAHTNGVSTGVLQGRVTFGDGQCT